MTIARVVRHHRKCEAVRAAEAAGSVADSMDVRVALIARVHKGEITLEQAQDELRRIKRDARRNGKTTRTKAYRNG